MHLQVLDDRPPLVGAELRADDPVLRARAPSRVAVAKLVADVRVPGQTGVVPLAVPGAFDPVQVGVDREAKGDGFWFDTRLPGNSNVGHEFRDGWAGPGGGAQYGVIGPYLSPDERQALVEYLKVHRDPETPAGRVPPGCGLR